MRRQLLDALCEVRALEAGHGRCPPIDRLTKDPPGGPSTAGSFGSSPGAKRFEFPRSQAPSQETAVLFGRFHWCGKFILP